MTLFSRRAGAALALLAAAALATVVAAPADAALIGRTVYIHPGDLVDPTGVTSGATQTFTPQGVHIQLATYQDALAGTFKTTPTPLISTLGKVQYSWTGTQAQPGIHYDIDVNGDGVADLELVGEHAYGNDVWLNTYLNNPGATIPTSTFQRLSPCTGTKARFGFLPWSCNPSSGFGNTYHGQLSDWVRALASGGYFSQNIVKGGWGAAGSVEDGVLGSITYGFTTYRLTN